MNILWHIFFLTSDRDGIAYVLPEGYLILSFNNDNVNDNETDYSMENTLKSLVFTITTWNLKYWIPQI